MKKKNESRLKHHVNWVRAVGGVMSERSYVYFFLTIFSIVA